MTSDLRPGHYVDGRIRYALTYPNQAKARAVELARGYERPVRVYTRLFHGGLLLLDESLSSEGPRRVYAMTDSIDSPQEGLL